MRREHSIFLAAPILCAMLLVGGAAADTLAATPASTVQANITGYKFDPPELTVMVGTIVTWTNHDDVPHTVTSTDKRFKSSGALDTGDSYSYTFTAAGTYAYYCTVHPFMTGKVIVQGAKGG